MLLLLTTTIICVILKIVKFMTTTFLITYLRMETQRRQVLRHLPLLHFTALIRQGGEIHNFLPEKRVLSTNILTKHSY